MSGGASGERVSTQIGSTLSSLAARGKVSAPPEPGQALFDSEDPLHGPRHKRAGRPKGSKKGLRTRTLDGSGVLVDGERSMRRSTVSRSHQSEVQRRRNETQARPKQARPDIKFKYTQEELLTEVQGLTLPCLGAPPPAASSVAAHRQPCPPPCCCEQAVETEKANLRWLLTAQRNARAQETTAKGRLGFAAPIRVHSSRATPTTVTFSEVGATGSRAVSCLAARSSELRLNRLRA